MKLKASITVETSLIMPIVLLVIFFLLSLSFFEHDKAVFTEQAFAAARDKAMFEEQALYSANETKKSCMSTKNISYEIEDKKIKTELILNGNTRIYLFNRSLSVNRKQFYVKCYAPDMIRLVNLGISIKDMIVNGK